MWCIDHAALVGEAEGTLHSFDGRSSHLDHLGIEWAPIDESTRYDENGIIVVPVMEEAMPLCAVDDLR